MICLDTGPLVAIAHQDDQHHAHALRLWDRLREDKCVASNLVIVETLNLIARRIGGMEAAAFGKSLYASRWLQVVGSTLEDERAALAVLAKYAAHGVGMTDAVSFVLMKRLGIQDVCTFDHHFKIAGFTPLEV